MPERFPFVQLELAGSVGLDDARYLVREPDERVLVIRVRDAPPPPRRRVRRRRPRTSDASSRRPPLPLTTLTAIRPATLGTSEEAAAWLERVRADGDVAAAEIAAAVELANRAVAAQRAASLDAGLADVFAEHAEAVRIGYGPGERLADGRWEAAIEIPRGERRGRIEGMRPQETIAAVLAGRETVPPSVTTLLRARADLDAGRPREAALQLRVGFEALLAELDRDPLRPAGADAASRHEADLGALGERRPGAGEAANEALRGELSDERAAWLADTLAICERVLRRRRASAG